MTRFFFFFCLTYIAFFFSFFVSTFHSMHYRACFFFFNFFFLQPFLHIIVCINVFENRVEISMKDAATFVCECFKLRNCPTADHSLFAFLLFPSAYNNNNNNNNNNKDCNNY
ncbi:hypothetical protein, unlikely [Trypanosoma brucei gambiense DAL972]|uniref:Uncharacterized protein n=1 Tax=Trypanosoma brucei gambiense (strain MHOM/CI/86/DAL972) TaxID=679716 RepID=C9ZU17_TRYB9|nr:hypothetical protein, unlikely [Trypanosoma brucei gambiense DAL972]CBH12903.1 hypothetical protein, unlikely [Trypanosoma brucei gambiense DAL972]|eukprot:XP_011775182.1 hypothetical protein, unlikely [Trypanosoma brucei gambiense DAL972]